MGSDSTKTSRQRPTALFLRCLRPTNIAHGQAPRRGSKVQRLRRDIQGWPIHWMMPRQKDRPRTRKRGTEILKYLGDNDHKRILAGALV
jgi:hypothetical protein